jgi:hypothetical protein
MTPTFDPAFPPLEGDDASTHGHRQMIGALGMLLPPALIVIAWWRPTTGLERVRFLDSMSAYYYSGAVATFCGVLAALAVFMLTYRGFRDSQGNISRLDQNLAWFAGIAAALVALFPTTPPAGAATPLWWREIVGDAHGFAAAGLFIAFAVFSLVLFPKKGKSSSKWKGVRNVIHRVCGVMIVVCIIWAAVAIRYEKSILLPEALALEFFGISWLTKGRALYTAAKVSQRALHFAKHPSDLLASMKHTLVGE